MKADMVDGSPGGCTNARAGSAFSQYSSLQSIGKSRSKLDWLSRKLIYFWTISEVPYSSETVALGRPRKEHTTVSIHISTQKALFQSSPSTDGLGVRFLRWAPTSWAYRIPMPTVIQQASGWDVPCKYNVESYEKKNRFLMTLKLGRAWTYTICLQFVQRGGSWKGFRK